MFCEHCGTGPTCCVCDRDDTRPLTLNEFARRHQEADRRQNEHVRASADERAARREYVATVAQVVAEALADYAGRRVVVVQPVHA